MDFEQEIKTFIARAKEKKLRMIMVGGGAVNFHGYKRHSADVDFWIDISPENLEKLLLVLQEMGYALDALPTQVKEGKQNISLKISPEQELELITAFNPGKSFSEAWKDALEVELHGHAMAKYKVLDFDTLIDSKLKSGRPKDLLDVHELKRLH